MFNVQTIIGDRNVARDIITKLIEQNLATTGYIHEVEVITKWNNGIETVVQYAVGINCVDGKAVKEYIENNTDLLLPSIIVTEVETSLGYELFNSMSALLDANKDKS